MAWQRPSSLVAVLAAMLGVTATSQDTSGEAFYAAIRANDLPRLNGMLTAGANVNAKDERGITPLMYAAWVGSVDAMKRLLDHGADPNLTNSSGSTALMLSATDIAKVRLLKDRGANVNAASTRGRTALFLAAMSDPSADIVRLLISGRRRPQGRRQPEDDRSARRGSGQRRGDGSSAGRCRPRRQRHRFPGLHAADLRDQQRQSGGRAAAPGQGRRCECRERRRRVSESEGRHACAGTFHAADHGGALRFDRAGEDAARRRREGQRAGHPRHDAADARGRDRSSERRRHSRADRERRRPEHQEPGRRDRA